MNPVTRLTCLCVAYMAAPFLLLALAAYLSYKIVPGGKRQ